MTTLRILHFAEDELSAALSRDLLDRVVEERGDDWLRESYPDRNTRNGMRRFTDLDGVDGWAKRGDIKHAASTRQVRVLHRVDGNAALAAKGLLLAAKIDPECLVLFSFDRDRREHEASIRHGAEQTKSSLRRLVAEASPEFDVWVIAGWSPENKADEAALDRVKTNLSRNGYHFDPLDEPYRLTSDVSNDPRDAKKICAILCGLEPSQQVGPEVGRAQRCWQETSLDDLEKKGAGTGLPEYLRDVAEVVIPALGGTPPRR